MKRIEPLDSLILTIRGNKILLDLDLAKIYGVSTKRLNEQVKRNAARFPKDFIFHLSVKEKNEVVANCDHLARDYTLREIWTKLQPLLAPPPEALPRKIGFNRENE